MNEIEHEQAGNQVELVKYRTVNPKDSFILDGSTLPYHKRSIPILIMLNFQPS